MDEMPYLNREQVDEINNRKKRIRAEQRKKINEALNKMHRFKRGKNGNLILVRNNNVNKRQPGGNKNVIRNSVNGNVNNVQPIVNDIQRQNVINVVNQDANDDEERLSNVGDNRPGGVGIQQEEERPVEQNNEEAGMQQNIDEQGGNEEADIQQEEEQPAEQNNNKEAGIQEEEQPVEQNNNEEAGIQQEEQPVEQNNNGEAGIRQEEQPVEQNNEEAGEENVIDFANLDVNNLPEEGEGRQGVFELPQNEIQQIGENNVVQPDEQQVGQNNVVQPNVQQEAGDVAAQQNEDINGGVEIAQQNEDANGGVDINDWIILERPEELRLSRVSDIVDNEELDNERNNIANVQQENAGNDNGAQNAVVVENAEGGAVNPEAAEQPAVNPIISGREFLSGLYFVLNGEDKTFSRNEFDELMVSGVAMRMLIGRKAQEALERDDRRQIEKSRKQNQIKEMVKRLEDNRRDSDGMKRIEEFLKLDYTIFDSFDDRYIVFNFDRLNNAIEQSEYIEMEVLPLAAGAGVLSEVQTARVNALILAINDYKEYMNHRMMIIADPNYTLAFDEGSLKNAGDENAINERLEEYTSNRNLSEGQLSTLMRFITYKTGMGDNPLFAEHFGEKSDMLTRMQRYGYVAEDNNENEPVDEDVEQELNELEQQVNGAGAQQEEADNAQNGEVNQAQVDEAENVGGQQENIAAADIPEVPEIVLPKRRRQLNYLITGNNEAPSDMSREMTANRNDLAVKAREIYESWQDMNPELSLERALSDVSKYVEKGYILPPEILNVVREGLRPGQSEEARKVNEEVLLSGMYLGGNEEDAKLLPHILISSYMRSDFSAFDDIADEKLVDNYTEAKRLLNYGIALQELFEQTIENRTCLLSQDRADNFYAILSALKDYVEYAGRRVDIIRSPYYSLFNVDEVMDKQKLDEIIDRILEIDGDNAEYEADLLKYAEKYIDITEYEDKVNAAGFFERAAGYGYEARDEYMDEKPGMQEQFTKYVKEENFRNENLELFAALPDIVEYYGAEDEEAIANIAASNELRIERDTFNRVQRVVGSSADYDMVKNDPKYEENHAKRQALSERAGELLNNLNIDETDETDENIWLNELLSTDVSILDNVSSDEMLIEHFEEMLRLTCRWAAIKNKLDAYNDQGMKIPGDDRIRLMGLQAMLSDAQRYLIDKLNQIRNPFYKTMHITDEIGNEAMDMNAFNNLGADFDADDADLVSYVYATGVVINSPFLSKYAGSGKDTADRYIKETTVSEDERINGAKDEEISSMPENYAGVSYLFDGKTDPAQMENRNGGFNYLLGAEGLVNVNTELFSKDAYKREGMTERSVEAVNSFREYNEKVQTALSTAYERLDRFGYVNYDIDPKVINGIYTMLKLEDTEEAVKYNMELLMNLGAENNNTRGAAYKEMVNNVLAIDITKFDRCDDEYFISNYTELKVLSAPAIAFNQSEVVNTLSKNGYRISEQKRNNLVVLCNNIKTYIDYMNARMKVINHPLYELVFRETDNGKEYDPEELKSRMAKARQIMRPEDGNYIDALVAAFSVDFPFARRSMTMSERLTEDGYEAPEGGVYDEDIAENKAYQQELSTDNIIRETVELRTEQLVTNILKEMGTGNGSQSLEDYAKQKADGDKRREISEKFRQLPDFDGVEPLVLVMDLLADPGVIIEEFLALDFSELDNLDDEAIVNRYMDIAALYGVVGQVEPALEALKNDYNDPEKDAKDKPATATIAAVSGRIEMLNDVRNYILAKGNVIRSPFYEKHYNNAYMTYNEDYDGNQAKIDSMNEGLTEDESNYLKEIANVMSKPFLLRYTGNGKTTAEAYGKKEEQNNYAGADASKVEGERIDNFDENGRSEGELPGEAGTMNEALAGIEGELASKAMSGPLNELRTFSEGISTYRKLVYRRDKERSVVKDRKGRDKEVTKKTYVFDHEENREFSKDISNDMNPIKEQIRIIFTLLNEEMQYDDDTKFGAELEMLLNHFEVLSILCGQYAAGRRYKTSGEMDQAAIRQVRRIRDIAEYAHRQTYTSARMSRIYFRQQDISGRKIPWINMYHYAEQHIDWEQGLVPYTEINKEQMDAIKGVKNQRTKLKEFTPEDNSFVKIEHWMTIFSECKPDAVNAIDRELSIRDMEKIERLVNTTNMRANQGLPDDSVDFIRACEDMIHSYTATNIRLKKYTDNMKLETEDDKMQKQMLLYVMDCLKYQIDLYNAYKDKISDTYEVVKSDSKNRTISDVFLSWHKDYVDYALKKYEQMQREPIADDAEDK